MDDELTALDRYLVAIHRHDNYGTFHSLITLKRRMHACTELAATRASAHASLRFARASCHNLMTAGRTLRSRLLLAASPRHTASTIGPVSVSSGQRQCVRAYWAVFIATRFERPACERCDLIERPRGELPQLRLAGPFRSRLVWSGRVGGDALSCVLVDVQCDSVTQ